MHLAQLLALGTPARCSEGDPPPSLPAAIARLTGLCHLNLTWPVPGALPPSEDLPTQLSRLTRLTALVLKGVPAQQAPGWIGALTRLQHLLYDPYLPASEPRTLCCAVPRCAMLGSRSSSPLPLLYPPVLSCCCLLTPCTVQSLLLHGRKLAIVQLEFFFPSPAC